MRFRSAALAIISGLRPMASNMAAHVMLLVLGFLTAAMPKPAPIRRTMVKEANNTKPVWVFVP